MNTRLATLDDMHSAYSDFYKEVHGIRPRWVTFSSIEEAGEAMLSLQQEAEEVFAREREFEAQAAAKVEAHISTLISSGAGDRDTAIRWLHDAHDTHGDDEYLCYHLGLRYGYFRKTTKH